MSIYLIITAILILLILCLIIFIGLPIFIGWVLTHPPRVQVKVPVMLEGNSYKTVTFPSRQQGVTLHGWFIPAPNSNKTIIFSHGFHNNRVQSDVPVLNIATILTKSGYNVLMFDFRCNGESEGNFTSFGLYEKEDLMGAVDYVKNLDQAGEHVGIIGYSMGAATALLAAAEDSRVEAVIADSPFADLTEYLNENLSVWTRLPSIPFNRIILAVIPKMLKIDPMKVSPVKVVTNIGVPVLYIHGTADKDIPTSNSQLLYQASPENKNLWVVDGATHIGSYRKQPEEYKRQILLFFAKVPGFQPNTSA